MEYWFTDMFVFNANLLPKPLSHALKRLKDDLHIIDSWSCEHVSKAYISRKNLSCHQLAALSCWGTKIFQLNRWIDAFTETYLFWCQNEIIGGKSKQGQHWLLEMSFCFNDCLCLFLKILLILVNFFLNRCVARDNTKEQEFLDVYFVLFTYLLRSEKFRLEQLRRIAIFFVELSLP